MSNTSGSLNRYEMTIDAIINGLYRLEEDAWNGDDAILLNAARQLKRLVEENKKLNQQINNPTWRPMSEAPKDGTMIIAFGLSSDEVFPVMFNSDTQTWSSHVCQFEQENLLTGWIPMPQDEPKGATQ